jgi:riboflavin biosynthesis pyrimidine reductase
VHAVLLFPCVQVFWECGGTLAAPAIASGVIHKVLAFVAPKIIGGARAPTPVGELGNVEMTQVRGWEAGGTAGVEGKRVRFGCVLCLRCGFV